MKSCIVSHVTNARAVLLRAIAASTSHEELEHLRALALVDPGPDGANEVERAVSARRSEISAPSDS
jgi:transcription termination factor Rho